MHIDDDKRVYFLPPLTVEICSHKVDQIIEIFSLFCRLLLHRVLVALLDLVKHILDSPCPPDLSAHNSDHAQVLEHPLDPFLAAVFEGGLFGDLVQCTLHLQVHLCHPELNRAVIGLDYLFHLVLLPLVAFHSHHLLAFGHYQLLAVVKELKHMRLHGFRVRRSQDRKQIVIRKEIESGENAPL